MNKDLVNLSMPSGEDLMFAQKSQREEDFSVKKEPLEVVNNDVFNEEFYIDNDEKRKFNMQSINDNIGFEKAYRKLSYYAKGAVERESILDKMAEYTAKTGVMPTDIVDNVKDVKLRDVYGLVSGDLKKISSVSQMIWNFQSEEGKKTLAVDMYLNAITGGHPNARSIVAEYNNLVASDDDAIYEVLKKHALEQYDKNKKAEELFKSEALLMGDYIENGPPDQYAVMNNYAYQNKGASYDMARRFIDENISMQGDDNVNNLKRWGVGSVDNLVVRLGQLREMDSFSYAVVLDNLQRQVKKASAEDILFLGQSLDTLGQMAGSINDAMTDRKSVV